MKLNNSLVHIQIQGQFGFNEDNTPASQFNWAILPNPRLLRNDDESTIIGFYKEEDKLKISNEVQLMRLFACNIVRDLLTNDGIIDQKNIQHQINFDLPQNIKEYVAKVVDALGKEIINEINYQNDPIKPTKSKLDSLSLFSKQNIENE